MKTNILQLGEEVLSTDCKVTYKCVMSNGAAKVTNLQRGGLRFLFRTEFFFSDNTRVRTFIFLLCEAQILLTEFNIMFYDKYSESDFFFLH
jgi:hypothetical protein